MRPAYLAGQWYPGSADACREAIEAHAEQTDITPRSWRGLIAPHAGWAYSGDCAGRGYRQLFDAAPKDVDLVVVFGSHRGPDGPNTIFLGDAWDTPLGAIETDASLASDAARTLGFAEEPEHVRGRPDNAVELHLPFVRFFWPRARLLMLGVEASPRAMSTGARIGQLALEAGRQAVFIGSTDLTHYGANYGWAPKGSGAHAVRWVRDVNDAAFLDALLRDRPEAAAQHAIEERSACCPGATVAAIEAARAYAGAVAPTLVDHYSSYDVRPAASFVGYASLVL